MDCSRGRPGEPAAARPAIANPGRRRDPRRRPAGSGAAGRRVVPSALRGAAGRPTKRVEPGDREASLGSRPLPRCHPGPDEIPGFAPLGQPRDLPAGSPQEDVPVARARHEEHVRRLSAQLLGLAVASPTLEPVALAQDLVGGRRVERIASAVFAPERRGQLDRRRVGAEREDLAGDQTPPFRRPLPRVGRAVLGSAACDRGNPRSRR